MSLNRARTNRGTRVFTKTLVTPVSSAARRRRCPVREMMQLKCLVWQHDNSNARGISAAASSAAAIILYSMGPPPCLLFLWFVAAWFAIDFTPSLNKRDSLFSSRASYNLPGGLWRWSIITHHNRREGPCKQLAMDSSLIASRITNQMHHIMNDGDRSPKFQQRTNVCCCCCGVRHCCAWSAYPRSLRFVASLLSCSYSFTLLLINCCVVVFTFWYLDSRWDVIAH